MQDDGRSPTVSPVSVHRPPRRYAETELSDKRRLQSYSALSHSARGYSRFVESGAKTRPEHVYRVPVSCFGATVSAKSNRFCSLDEIHSIYRVDRNIKYIMQKLKKIEACRKLINVLLT